MGGAADPRVAGLCASVGRLRDELDAYPAELRDRRIAEEALDALAAMATAGVPDVQELRFALLQVAGAVGSVSALSDSVAAVRHAVELFGDPAPTVPEPRPPEAGEHRRRTETADESR
nr:DUF5955 family protein [Streptomyces sp. HNM0574]